MQYNNVKETIELLSIFSSDNYSTDEENIKNIIQKIIDYYGKYKRHRYHIISRFVNKKMSESEDSISYILNNIEHVLNFLEYNDKVVEQLIKLNPELELEELMLNIGKLYDHIALEEERIKNNSVIIRNSREQIERNVINTFNSITNNFQRKVDETSNSLNANIITVVGLFSAIIFVFFGGITTLSSFVNGLFRIDTKEELMLPLLGLLAVGFIIFNTIFLLLYSIAKIVNKNIGTVLRGGRTHYFYAKSENGCYIIIKNGQKRTKKCFVNEEDAEQYVNRKTIWANMRNNIKKTFCKVFLRFPYVTIINILLIFGMIFLYINL